MTNKNITKSFRDLTETKAYPLHIIDRYMCWTLLTVPKRI